ncbi:MAG TPA: hypothetical protein PKY77_11365 [Phycisphaerae bacterium]|nr:hypothetical protein [Phycisphaerae bacterium]HRY70320.1 hypothetical protein [Phycisphaerae bacterium]HSA28037.1 hypothetical protein [Phycisphaerae bacterium]
MIRKGLYRFGMMVSFGGVLLLTSAGCNEEVVNQLKTNLVPALISVLTSAIQAGLLGGTTG